MATPGPSAGDPTPVQVQRPAPPHRRFRPVAPDARRRRTAWPSGLFGMLALVAAVEGAVARRWEALADPVAFSWRLSAAAAETMAPGCGVVCAGDSLVKHGLIPRVIEASTGRRSYNLAAAAAPAPWTYFALRRAFEAGARPEAVVVDFKPSVLAGGPRFRLWSWPEVLSPRETCELIWETHSGAFAAELLLGELLPTFRSRHGLRDHLRAALRGETSKLNAMNAVCRRNWGVNAGANVATPRPSFDGAITEAQHRELLSHRFGVHRVNAHYLRRTLDLATSCGARVYLVVPPLSAALLARRAATGSEAGYDGVLHDLRRRYPGLTVLDARPARYPDAAFIDATHLNRLGSLALSADVAAVLRRDLGPGATPAGRWETLPAYRERPEPFPFEDVEQSRERLGIAWRALN